MTSPEPALDQLDLRERRIDDHDLVRIVDTTTVINRHVREENEEIVISQRFRRQAFDSSDSDQAPRCAAPAIEGMHSKPCVAGSTSRHAAARWPWPTRARDELLASGVSQRRERIRGTDALTASEARVVRIAAAGTTNRAKAHNRCSCPSGRSTCTWPPCTESSTCQALNDVRGPRT